MEPTVPALRLATAAVAPLIKKLFVSEGPGAGLAAQPVRISRLVSFSGQQQTLALRDLHKLTAELVRRAAAAKGPREAPPMEVRRELAGALTTALHGLGDLDMDVAQAVRLGPADLARRLPTPSGLSESATAHYEPLLQDCCLHILHFFTQRDTFVARTLTEQTRQLGGIEDTVQELAARIPAQRTADLAFEQRYAEHIERRHGELTIYGLDLRHAREWQLDAAYVSLEATADDTTRTALPAERALARRDHVLLRGAAGSGKTTLVQWLAVTTARQEPHEHLHHLLGRVPFVLPLRRVLTDGELPAPDDFLHAVRSPLAAAQPAGWADRLLTAGRGVLLVDGIDEIPEQNRSSARRWVRELMADYPGNLWLITARPSAVQQDWLTDAGFHELTLAPMTPQDSALFIHRWHRAAGADTALADHLVATVRSSRELARLALNPLMCGLLCALHRERDGFLPHGRKDLYESALAMLLERRDLERRVQPLRSGPPLSREENLRLLLRLAHWMIRNQRTEMERADALTQVDRVLEGMPQVTGTPQEVLTHLLERSGLLREPAADRVDFVHRTFQDYLGARAAVEERDIPMLLNNAHRDQWGDVVRMAVALAGPGERDRILEGLVEGCAGARSDLPLSRQVPAREIRKALLAADALEQATAIDAATRDSVLAPVSRLIPPQDLHTATLLSEVDGPVAGLLPGPEGLSDEEAYHVVVTATRIGGDAVLPLLARYRHHAGAAVRRQLSYAWHRFDTERYAEEILRHIDPEGLYFTAHTLAHLRVLRRLDRCRRVRLFGSHHAADILREARAMTITHLWLDQPLDLTVSEWSTAFPHLREVRMPDDETAGLVEVPSGVAVRHMPRIA